MKYATPLFDRIAREKRERILTLAGKEFAETGYSGANINKIADVIGISVGSLYKYFGTKENFFLAVVCRGREELERVIGDNAGLEMDLAGKIDHLIGIIQKHSRENPELIRLYAELTAEGNAYMAKKLSDEMENITAGYYRDMIAQYRDKGEIDTTVDPSLAAFFLDNLFLTLQFSYAGAYYRERMRLFLGDEMIKDDEKVRKGLLQFILSALGAALG